LDKLSILMVGCFAMAAVNGTAAAQTQKQTAGSNRG
jgi:hypothetical protein